MANDMNPDVDRQQLLADLLTLSDLPTDLVSQLGDRIEQHPGFLSVERITAEVFQESQKAAAVSRLISGLVPESLKPLQRMVENWRSSEERVKEQLTDERFNALLTNLPLLVRTSPALKRTRKAGALQTITGNELLGVMFVCDARLVYNNARNDIDGYVPLATMKMMYEQQNGFTEEIEFVMTPEEIDLLIERAEEARDKIAVLNKKVTGWLPNGTAGAQS